MPMTAPAKTKEPIAAVALIAAVFNFACFRRISFLRSLKATSKLAKSGLFNNATGFSNTTI